MVWQVENTNSDSFDLYYGLFMYNVNATEQVRKGCDGSRSMRGEA